MVTFARGADGERVLVQPSHLIEEVAKIAGQTFPKTITLRTKYPQDLWMVEADPTQLQQVLLNLCVNARDAMPEGGVLRLTSEISPSTSITPTWPPARNPAPTSSSG